MPRYVVDVTLKPEILDPQGQAIQRALGRLGYQGVAGIRQGKHFELEVSVALDAAAVADVANMLLANPVIENFTVRAVAEPEPVGPDRLADREAGSPDPVADLQVGGGGSREGTTADLEIDAE